MIALCDTPIDPGAVLGEIASPASGGIDIFIGTVRDASDGATVTRLEYTAYEPMAEDIMRSIEEEIRSRWEVHNVILIHRIGVLSVGDVAVVTAVAAAHRTEAFEACRFAIERIKADVPIWKKEFGPGGVEGRWMANADVHAVHAGGRERVR
ncbi:MAG: molybdenum cofactor biosynthesis protein MoaE [Bacteroidota bacterium]